MQPIAGMERLSHNDRLAACLEGRIKKPKAGQQHLFGLPFRHHCREPLYVRVPGEALIIPVSVVDRGIGKTECVAVFINNWSFAFE